MLKISSLLYRRQLNIRALNMPAKKNGDAGKQRNIATFFNKTAKRSSNNDNSTPAKHVKTNDDAENDKMSSSLSPEQKQRMESKKQEALLKLNVNLQDIDMGVSWKKALENEFSKPYFKKVIFTKNFLNFYFKGRKFRGY